MLVANTTISEDDPPIITLDKTWNEIKTAYTQSKIVIMYLITADDENSYYANAAYLGGLSADSGNYVCEFALADGGTVSSIMLSTNNADGYPYAEILR